VAFTTTFDKCIAGDAVSTFYKSVVNAYAAYHKDLIGCGDLDYAQLSGAAQFNQRSQCSPPERLIGISQSTLIKISAGPSVAYNGMPDLPVIISGGTPAWAVPANRRGNQYVFVTSGEIVTYTVPRLQTVDGPCGPVGRKASFNRTLQVINPTTCKPELTISQTFAMYHKGLTTSLAIMAGNLTGSGWQNGGGFNGAPLTAALGADPGATAAALACSTYVGNSYTLEEV